MYIKKQPQIAAIKRDASKMIRTVLGFIIVRKGLVFANFTACDIWIIGCYYGQTGRIAIPK